MDNRYPGLAIYKRMRILVDRPAMGRPPGMAHPYGAGKFVKVVFRMDLFQPSTVLLDGKLATIYSHLANGVVSSVFKPFERAVDQWRCLGAVMKNATEDTAQ